MNRCRSNLLISGKRIGIAGAGLSGKGAARLCEKYKICYTLMDEREGFENNPKFEDYSYIVFSPGFSPSHAWIQAVKNTGIPWINEIDFAMSFCKIPVIAVTGTNGKTSTVELITQLLCNSGKKALAVGNNGHVLSEVVSKIDSELFDSLVCEVSSYQAWSMKFFRPICTLYTNIAPDHIYYHGGFENYLKAKERLLVLTQGPIICSDSLKPWISNNYGAIFAPKVETLQSWLDPFPMCFSQGQRENFVLVRTFAEKFGIKNDVLIKTLQQFQQPLHRLHCCCKKGDWEFWNDSKGTNLHAVVSALESLKHKERLVWILGGRGKGENLRDFVETFNRYPNVRKIYLIGETGKLLQTYQNVFHAQVVYLENLSNVFRDLSSQNACKVVVLSPGFASWDQFKSFEHRGEVFEELVHHFMKLCEI